MYFQNLKGLSQKSITDLENTSEDLQVNNTVYKSQIKGENKLILL